jgi:hypothetical protein
VPDIPPRITLAKKPTTPDPTQVRMAIDRALASVRKPATQSQRT